MSKRRQDIAWVLKDAFRRSGRSMKSIADETGIAYSMVHGFFVSGTDIRIGTASKLAMALGVEVIFREE